jgi:hypothetical protein
MPTMSLRKGWAVLLKGTAYEAAAVMGVTVAV